MTNVKKFVIQQHSTAGHVHWDLMLQTEGVLETYRLQLPPQQLLHHTTTAIKIFDHPIKFLTYQGSVNNGKGTVNIVESGTYKLLTDTENLKHLQLDGKILKSKFTLKCLDGDTWQLAPDK